ncbi:hypothetical protein CPT_Machias_248 [Staphylococcus phage Machias]|nr:hypothetical protein CPT_Machias_248 [Staphylococcus phage Machias]
MSDILLYVFSGTGIVGGISTIVISNIIFRKNKRKINNNEDKKFKEAEELITLDEEKLMDKLNHSYKLETAFDGKERYYSLHYLLSHPELEFNRDINIPIFDARLDRDPSQTSHFRIDPFEKGKLFDYEMSFEMLPILLLNIFYKNIDEMKKDDNNFIRQFKDLIDSDINELPKLEKSSFELYSDYINKMYKYSFLGTKILIGLVEVNEKIQLVIVDENQKVYIKKHELQFHENSGNEMRLIYRPEFFINQSNNELAFFNKRQYKYYHIDENSEIFFKHESLNNESLIDKKLYLYLHDIKVEKVSFNTEGLMNYVLSDVKRRNDNLSYLEDKRIDRDLDKNHWSNMIETNYRLNDKEKKKFIKNLHRKLVEQKRLKDIEEFKEYSK